MRQLSELDASFLTLENEKTPMHIGGLYIFDSADPQEPFSYQHFYRHIESRLHVAEIFRQKLLEAPLRLGHPCFVDDPDFHLSKHLQYVTLPAPATETRLAELAGEWLSKPLRRDRPLWEITYVDGLNHTREQQARFALIVKIHHAAIDSFSGDEIIGALLDFSPEPRFTAPPKHWTPRPLPSKKELFAEGYFNPFNAPLKLASMARDSAANLFYSMLVQRLQKLNIPHFLFKAPTTVFNRPVSAARQLDYVEFDLADLRAIKKQIKDVSLNDILLTLCAEALRDYLHERGKLPPKSLTAMLPISVRSQDISRPTGNQMSAMLVSLATQEADMLQRLALIHEHVKVSSIYKEAISADALKRLFPSTMAGLSARIYTEFQLAQRHRPVFNVPITHIPGPQIPLYLHGARMIRHVGSSPLFDGVGLAIVMVGYDAKLTIGVTSCPDVVEDAASFVGYLHNAKTALEQTLAEHPAPLDLSTLQSGEGTPQAGLIEDVSGLLTGLLRKLTGQSGRAAKPTDDD